MGRRTQELIRGLGDPDWKGELDAARLEKAAALGCFGGRGEMIAMPLVLLLLILIFGGIVAASMPVLIGIPQEAPARRAHSRSRYAASSKSG